MDERTFKSAHFVLALSALLIFCGINAAALVSPAFGNVRMEGYGFDSPERAVNAYLEALRDAELPRMINAFAVESYVDNYKFEASLYRVKTYVPLQEIKLPNSNEFVKALNAESRRNRVSTMILSHYAFLCGLEVNSVRPIVFKEDANIHVFISQLNTALNSPKLQTLKIIGFIQPAELSEKYSEPRNLENMAKRAEIFGAESMVSCAIVFELDGKEYIFCPDVISYGGRWYISELGGTLGMIMNAPFFSAGTLPVSDVSNVDVHKLIKPVENIIWRDK